MSDIVKDFVNAIKSEKKTSAYDTTAVVTRVEDDVAWVHIAGGVDETPVRLTINAKAGDSVQVRVSGGRAWLTGNMSAPPTDNEMAQRALDYGKIANDAAQKATADAQVASEAASSAKRSADEAQRTAESVEGIARHAEEVAEGVEAIAERAETSAGEAKTAADKATKDLAQVENVVGVVSWIAEHGTMTSQAGETFDSSKVYFVVDPNGDYHIGSTHYSVVQNPVAEDIDSYYLLSIDESVQNYVTTHLYADSEGLWLIPEDNATAQTSSKKILIAVGGTGHTYETAGTYIIEKVNGIDTIVAEFTADGAQIGQSGESRLEIDYHSLKLVDKEGDDYFYVSDLRDKDDNYQAIITETFQADGLTTTFTVGLSVSAEVSATDESDSSNIARRNGQDYTFVNTPTKGATIIIVYKTDSQFAKAFTFGKRKGGSLVGFLSVAEGYYSEASGGESHAEGSSTKASGYATHAEGRNTEASGNNSHAEGYYSKASGAISHAEGRNTKASGYHAHAEGWDTEASGNNSHAQNFGTIAGYDRQTAIGTYNDNDPDNAFEIGNGTSDNNRSNAFAVDWDGNIYAQGMAGMIQMFAGATAPNGWLICDGQAVSRTTYSTLFDVIGTTYGSGDGSTTFNLPDMRDRFPVGAGDTYNEGDTGGYAEVTLTDDEMPAHTHGEKALSGHLAITTAALSSTGSSGIVSNVSGGTGQYTGTNSQSRAYARFNINASHEHSIEGGDQPHENRPPYIGLNFIICTGKTL